MNGEKPLKKTVSYSLDIEVIDEIKRLADESDRSASQYVNLVLKRYLKSRSEKNSEE